MKKALLMLMLALSFCFITTGCDKEEEVEEVEYQVIGNKSEDAYAVLLINSTGQDIKGIAIKTSDVEEYPSNMMKTDEVLKQEDTAQLFYTPETTAESENSESTEKAVNILYNVQITLADDTVYELTSFDFVDIKEDAELCLEDEVIFVKYISAATDDEVSTKELELGAKQLKEEQEAAEEAAKKAAEEAANAQSTTNNNKNYTNNNNYTNNSANNNPSNNTSSGTNNNTTNNNTNTGGTTEQAPSQDSESCLGGVEVPSQGSEGCLDGVEVPSQDSEGCLGDVAINP